MKVSQATRDQIKRKVLFVPCVSKQHLHAWIKEYLHLDIPDTKVDPESTSTPMDLIWEIYDAGMKNERTDFSEILGYASRDSMKTLGAAVLEVLAVVHLQRDVAHMAAIEQQAKKAQSYVRDFFAKPYLRDFVVLENERRREICRYFDATTGENLTLKQFQELSPDDKMKYKEVRNYITIILCTMASTNSEHVPFFCVDGSTFVNVNVSGFQDTRTISIEQLYEWIAASNSVEDLTTEHIVDRTGKFEVLAYDHEARKTKFKSIEIAHRRQVESTVTIQFDGTMLCCTPDHPLFVPGAGYKEAKDIEKGDVVLGIEPHHKEIVGRKVVSVKDTGKRTVYDLTVKGFHNFFTNGVLSHNCVDEVDVVANPKAYEEAKMIPAPRDGKMPITLYTSTRKFSFGLVQKEIDNAAKSGLHIRHWNIIDVTERCPETRHLPEQPKVPVYYSRHDLRTVTPEEYANFSPDKKERYEPDEAFAGCMKNCKMFAMCRGRLATKQKAQDPNSKANWLLKPVAHTQNVFSKLSVETAKAQLLCWKPSTEGLVYPNFDRDIHLITPAQMAEKITGDVFPQDMTKAEMIAVLKTRELQFVAGMDFGYTHNFAVALGAVDGHRCFVLDVLSMPELEVEQQIELCNSTIRHYNPKIFADPENPQAIVTFKKRGYRMTKVDKAKGSVVGGIEILRGMLRPAMGEPRIFFLQGDDGCELLAKRFASYHWKLDAAGAPTNIPDEDGDDELDAIRYLVMSVFNKNGKVTAAGDGSRSALHIIQDQDPNRDWLAKTIQEKIGDVGADNTSTLGKAKSGGFFWDI